MFLTKVSYFHPKIMTNLYKFYTISVKSLKISPKFTEIAENPLNVDL